MNLSNKSNLTLSYQGNQLIKVEDTAPNPTLSMSMDFEDGTDQEIEYSYDANGNQTKDLNKGITGIEYNFLNLPRRINFSGTNFLKNEYVYSAAGTKLSVIHKSTTEKRTDYVGNMIYENGSLKRILVDGGYIENGIYHFYIQDHLGNNRVVAKADGTVVQTNHYYPYGMSFAEGTFPNKQPYKYNGKELDTENGLNLYNYDARQMDAISGRFTSIDPMAEKYYAFSPYIYCSNNPMRNIDPDGKDWYKVKNIEGVWEYHYNDEIRSQNMLNEVVKNGVYLGITHTENDIYYSLMGSTYSSTSKEGMVMQKIDEALIKEAVPEKYDVYGNKLSGGEKTDFDIGIYNRISSLKLREPESFTFEIEGGYVAYFTVDKGQKNMVKSGGLGYVREGVVRGQGNRGIGGLKSGVPIYFERQDTPGNRVPYAAQIIFYSKQTGYNFLNRYDKLFKGRFK